MSTATVTVYRNGDSTFAGKKIIVNKKQIRTLDAFLDKVTKDTSMKTAARRIKTPTGRHTIKELDSLETGGCYVAMGPEAFKRLPYTQIKEQIKSTPRKEVEIHPVIHNPRLQMSGRARKVAASEPQNNRSIHVFRNGDDLYPSHKMLLDKRSLSSMDNVLKVVTNKVHLQSGAVFWLFTVDGREITHPSQLENGGQYVAVGHGKKFKKLAYSDQGSILSPRSRVPTKTQIKVTQARQSRPIKPKNGTTKGYKRKSTSTTSNSQASPSESAHDDPSVQRESLFQEVQEKIQENFQEEFISQPPHEHSPTPKDNVYQASGENKENAQEVKDDRDMKEDKPIDQMLAEEVEEEEEDFEKENDEEVKQNDESEEEKDKNDQRENSGLGGFLEDLIDDVKEKFDSDDDEEDKKKEENQDQNNDKPAEN